MLCAVLLEEPFCSFQFLPYTCNSLSLSFRSLGNRLSGSAFNNSNSLSGIFGGSTLIVGIDFAFELNAFAKKELDFVSFGSDEATGVVSCFF